MLSPQIIPWYDRLLLLLLPIIVLVVGCAVAVYLYVRAFQPQLDT